MFILHLLDNLANQVLAVDRIAALDSQFAHLTRMWCRDNHFL